MRSIPASMVVISVVLLAGCAKQPPQVDTSTAAEQPTISPADRGIARARKDIAEGNVRILYYGKPWSAGKPLVDDDSGLPVEIVEGCCVTAEFVQETDAYNRTMREALQDAKSRARAYLERRGMDWGDPVSVYCTGRSCRLQYLTSEVETAVKGTRKLDVPFLGGEPYLIPRR